MDIGKKCMKIGKSFGRVAIVGFVAWYMGHTRGYLKGARDHIPLKAHIPSRDAAGLIITTGNNYMHYFRVEDKNRAITDDTSFVYNRDNIGMYKHISKNE